MPQGSPIKQENQNIIDPNNSTQSQFDRQELKVIMRKPHYSNPIDNIQSYDTDNQATEIISKSNTLGPDAMAQHIFDEDYQTFLMKDYENK